MSYSFNTCLTSTSTPPGIFSYRKFWAKRFGVAPVLPMSRDEMELLGWDSCDVIIVTGDAYVDHPSFGMALIGRLLEAQGFRVGIISQPDWHNVDAFKVLGKPNLFFGVTAGNMDSMVNNYTADRKIRSDDAYTPNAMPYKRPNRAVIVYAQRCREAYKDTPIVLGGIEASLRRLAHYDYWSDSVRRSILFDAKADILLYGNAERALVELAHRLARKENIANIVDIRGTVFTKAALSIQPDKSARSDDQDQPYRTTLSDQVPLSEDQPGQTEGQLKQPYRSDQAIVRLPSFEQVKSDPALYAEASRIFHLETNPHHARPLVQAHGNREVWVNPPPIPLTTVELDGVYSLPYSRLPHPSYGNAKIPAYEMIRFSVSIMRGCFGGCAFCSITAHEGRIIQSRSEQSILHEIETIRDRVPEFTGIISDLGGPTANMYRLQCRNIKAQKVCRRCSCIYPAICKNLDTNHRALIELYRQARQLPGIKKILIASGVRYDLAIKDPEYVKELVTFHVGGYLKIAPEHIAPGPLSKMMKPDITSYYRFKELFDKYSSLAGKEQYLIPYFIAAHPGTTLEDMLELALWLKANNFRLDQVQNFLPTPMTRATTMYHTALNPFNSYNYSNDSNHDNRDTVKVLVPKGERIRRIHKAFLRYHDPVNWPLLRATLRSMGRSDLIGTSKKRHLVPPY